MEEKVDLQQPAAGTDATEDGVSVRSNADLGLQLITQHGGAIDYTAEEDRRVRWKLDLCLMPIVSKPQSARRPTRIALTPASS